MDFRDAIKNQTIINLLVWVIPFTHIIILTKASPFTSIYEKEQTELIQFLLTNTVFITLTCFIAGLFSSLNSAKLTQTIESNTIDGELFIKVIILVSTIACLFHVYAKFQNPYLEIDTIKGFRNAWIATEKSQQSFELKLISFIGMFFGSLIIVCNTIVAYRSMTENILRLVIYLLIVFVIGFLFTIVIGSRNLFLAITIANVSGVSFHLITKTHNKYFLEIRRALLIIIITFTLNFSCILGYSYFIVSSEIGDSNFIVSSETGDSKFFIGDHYITEYNLKNKTCIKEQWFCKSKYPDTLINTVATVSIYASHGIFNGATSSSGDNPRNEFFTAINFYFSKLGLSPPFAKEKKNYGAGTIPLLFAIKQDFGSLYSYLLSCIFGGLLGFLSANKNLLIKFRHIFLFIFSGSYFVYATSWLGFAPSTFPFVIVVCGTTLGLAPCIIVEIISRKNNRRCINRK